MVTQQKTPADMHLERLASELIKAADAYGVVVTLTRQPLKPLAMGHDAYRMDVWPKREPAQ